MAPEDFFVFGYVDHGPRLQLSWLNRSETGSCSIADPQEPPASLRDLRDDRRRTSLSSIWPPALASALAQHLTRLGTDRRARVRLRIHARSSSVEDINTAIAWELAPIEYLRLDGVMLHDVATVERCIPSQLDGAFSTRGKLLLINRWFARKDQDGAWSAPPPDAEYGLKVREEAADIETFLNRHRDLTDHAALFVIAHGDGPAARHSVTRSPSFWVRDRSGAREVAWDPFREITTPALIGILACADDDFELVRYARSLLSTTTRCVLVPVGRIDAEQAALFTAEFARRWHSGATVRDALLQVVDGHADRMSMRRDLLDRLWILGDAELRRTQPAIDRQTRSLPLQALPTPDLRARGTRSPRARAALLDRATRHSVQKAGSLRGAIRETGALFDVDVTHDPAARRLMRQLDGAYSHVAPVTQRWLAQYLVGLGERYDHRLMQRYQELAERDRSLSFGIPQFVGRRCMALARTGEFVEGAACLARGFKALHQLDDVPLERFELTGVLLNYLIDFNLPDLAVRMAERLDQEAARFPDDTDVRRFRFTLMDRSARAAFRAGQVRRGFELMRRKYQQATARGEDGGRECAWLIYFASWDDPSARHTCRDLDLLDAAIRPVEDALCSPRSSAMNELVGNDNEAYLLRALAAWHWASPPRSRARSRVGMLLGQAWPSIAWHLRRRDDPGPFGLAIGYLAASGNAAARRAWPQARDRLLAARYDSETVGTSLLQGVVDDSIRQALAGFQQTRRDLISQLVQVLANEEIGTTPDSLWGEVERRSTLETRLLEQAADLQGGELRGRIIESGLVPL